MWQDFIFLVGSVVSIVSLTPTLRSALASVPLATSLPSAIIGISYGATYFTLGMPFSAAGSLAAGFMWSLILAFRRPTDDEGESLLSTGVLADSV